MTTIPLVDGNDIEKLTNHELRKIMNELLTAEAGRNGIPLADLDLTTRDTDPDAGIDARIKWPDRPHETFNKGENILQYKSGNITDENIRDEFKKPGVQEALKHGGNYLLVAGKDLVHKNIVNLREKTLKKLCRRKHISPKRVKIMFGSAVARWISRHPSVVALPELRKNIEDFVTVQRWRTDNRQLSNPYLPDQSRKDTTSGIHEFLDSASLEGVLRIEGPAGVGKTRLALEALSPRQYSARSLYALSADDREVQPFLSAIYNNFEKSAIVILDECDVTKQNQLRQYAENSNGRLKLICIGLSDVLQDSPSSSLTRVYQLRPLPDENIRAILRAAFLSMPDSIVEQSVRLSGGYVKLAMFIAGALDKLSPEQQQPLILKQLHDIRTFLHRFVDSDTLKSLQVLSLLARIGWEEDLREEAKNIAKFVGLPFSKLQSAVTKLRKQGVVIPRARYLYVSPELLAIEAAADLWDEKGSELISVLLKLKASPRRQLLRRLAVMGEHPEVRKAVQRILSKKGLYPSLDKFDEPFLGELFRFLSSILPNSAAELLEELFHNAPRAKLLNFDQGRREILWTVESLLRWPETSLTAARVAMKLALSENETIGNNATGIFRQYFQLFLSGSPLSIEDRFVLLDELMDIGDESARGLLVEAAGAILQINASRAGGDTDPLSNKPYPAEWRPRVNADVWSARRKALNYLERIEEENDSAARSARAMRIGAVRALLQYGQADDAVEMLRSIVPANDGERTAILQACHELQKTVNLPDNLRTAIDVISQSLYSQSYFDQLRRWAGRRANFDFDHQGESGFSAADKRVEELASRGYSAGIGEAEMAWLASPAAEAAWIFGNRLGQLDQNRKFFHQILTHTPDDLNSVLLASYIRGLGEQGGEQIRETLLDHVAEQKPEAAFGATWRNDATERGAERIIKLVSSGRVDPSALRILIYGAWVGRLTPRYIVKIVELLLDRDGARSVESVLAMIDQSVRNSAITIQEFGDLIWQALETKPNPRTPNFDWRWSQVASLVVMSDPKRFTHIFMTFFDTDEAWLDVDSARSVLEQATKSNAEAVWDIIGTALLSDELSALRLRLKLEGWFGELIPAKILVTWASQNGRSAYLTSASLLNSKTGQLSANARTLLSAAPNFDEIMQIFDNGLHSGTFWGPLSNHMQQQASTLEKWGRDEDPRIRRWAEKRLKDVKKRIRRQKYLEQEE